MAGEPPSAGDSVSQTDKAVAVWRRTSSQAAFSHDDRRVQNSRLSQFPRDPVPPGRASVEPDAVW